jgi:ribosome-associated protein
MAGFLEVRPGLRIPDRELTWRFSRSAGPGGQSVNTADSRVSVSFDVARSTSLPPLLRRRALDRLGSRLVDGILTLHAQEHRSQLRNREAVLRRLAALLRDATAAPGPRRRPTRPSRGAVERRLSAKRARADVKRLRRGDDDGRG